jgi:miniconductance mechanosensitive channel
MERFISGYSHQPWLQSGLAILALIALSLLANWVAKRVVLRLVLRLLGHLPSQVETAALGSVVARLSNIVPVLVIQLGVGTIPNAPVWAVTLAHSICTTIIILTVAIALSASLNLGEALYQRRPDAVRKPIKGYIQVVKILIYGAAIILIIAALMDQSPLLLLSGLGAMAAVLMLVFKDTILSLVASVQIGSNDMVRVGDWIEMPQLNANGDVIDIALHTVKIQNFDKTITTIPTYRLITESFKNWRGMADSQGRRIMRSIMIDQNSICFLDADEMEQLERFALLRPYLQEKREEIVQWNDARAVTDEFNARRMTNIGTFRSYVLMYLTSLEGIAKDETLLVRQLSPTEHGLPIEIYAFAATPRWAEYETIQADIFDHLLAILPHFGLQLFQRPTGRDVRCCEPNGARHRLPNHPQT